jgi:hypothetical protein
MSQSETESASKAYARVGQVVMDPRDLEASLLLKAAAKLQAVLEAWDQKPRPRLQTLYCTIAASGSCSSMP